MKNIPIIFLLLLLFKETETGMMDDWIPAPFIDSTYELKSTQNISFKYYRFKNLDITYDLKPFKTIWGKKDDLLYFYISTIDVTFPNSEQIKYKIVGESCDEIKHRQFELDDDDWKNANVVFRKEPNVYYKLNEYIIEVDPEFEIKDKISLIIRFDVNSIKKGNLFIYRKINPQLN